MANFSEISEALEVVKKAGCEDVALLHCVSEYPALIESSRILEQLKY